MDELDDLKRVRSREILIILKKKGHKIIGIGKNK